MFKSEHQTPVGTYSFVKGSKVVIFIVLAKLLLIGGAMVLIYFGSGYIGVGYGMLLLHAVLLLTVATVAVKRFSRHCAILDSSSSSPVDHSRGIVLHGAAGYDVMARLLTFGREGRFRELMLRPANLQQGDAVLDVACGTGTLAIAAKRQVGLTGTVTALDASAAMVERARHKAQQAGHDISFIHGTAQALPFDSGQFDIVMGTLMLHHLSKPVRSAFAREARRVLKTNGRLLLVDWSKPLHKSRMPKFHRHGHVDMGAIRTILADAGFEIDDIGDVGTKNLRYVRARPLHESYSSPSGPDMQLSRAV